MSTLDRLDIDCDDAYGQAQDAGEAAYDASKESWPYDPLDTEAAEAELKRQEAQQEWIFQRCKKLQRLIALYKLHDELKGSKMDGENSNASVSQ